jgi:hypothetical protein
MWDRYVDIMCIAFADKFLSVREQVHNYYVCTVLFNLFGSERVISRGYARNF